MKSLDRLYWLCGIIVLVWMVFASSVRAEDKKPDPKKPPLTEVKPMPKADAPKAPCPACQAPMAYRTVRTVTIIETRQTFASHRAPRERRLFRGRLFGSCR